MASDSDWRSKAESSADCTWDLPANTDREEAEGGAVSVLEEEVVDGGDDDEEEEEEEEENIEMG